MKHFSFLLGAGFSKPAGYPLATEINNKFQSLTHKDFFIHTSQSAHLISKGYEQRWQIEKYQYMFVEEFIKFYNEKIITDNFHYEDFVDYYMDLYRRKNLSQSEHEFFNDFRNRYNYPLDHTQLIYSFHRTYAQLVSEIIIIEWPESPSILGPVYNKNDHAQFLYLLDYLSQKYIIHIHSLNHDLLMEKYFRTSVLDTKYSDGFDDVYSPYFADVHNYYCGKNSKRKTYTRKIRLRRYNGKFNKAFNFYKLHGSVDNYIATIYNGKFDMIKMEYQIINGSVKKEISTCFGEIKNEMVILDVAPEILSGTTEKTRKYGDTIYYKDIHKKFIINLKKSDNLIVIGYSFKDSGINEYLKTHFLNDINKQMLVVDITKPESELLDSNNVGFIECNVLDMDIEVIKSKLEI